MNQLGRLAAGKGIINSTVPASGQEFAERLVANMTGGEVGQPIAKKKWVLLGKQVKVTRQPTLITVKAIA